MKQVKTLQRWAIFAVTAAAVGAVLLTSSPAVAELPPGQQLVNAAVSGDLAAVRALLDQGIDPNYRDRSGNTPLMGAASKGNAEIIAELVRRGVQVDPRGDGMSALNAAALAGNAKAVQVLLDNHADANRRSGRGLYPLQAAACSGHAMVVRQLLDAGADVDQPDQIGRTALMCAARAGDEEMVAMLLERHADTEHRSGVGETALSLAAENQQVSVTQLLLAHGAQPPVGKHANRQR